MADRFDPAGVNPASFTAPTVGWSPPSSTLVSQLTDALNRRHGQAKRWETPALGGCIVD
mgnify:CR=1 FL=1